MCQVSRRWRRIERVGELMRSGCSSCGRCRVRWRRQPVRTRSAAARQAVHGSSTGRQTCQTNGKPHTITDFLLRRDLLGAKRVNYVHARASVHPSVNVALFVLSASQTTSTFLASFPDTELAYCQWPYTAKVMNDWLTSVVLQCHWSPTVHVLSQCE